MCVYLYNIIQKKRHTKIHTQARNFTYIALHKWKQLGVIAAWSESHKASRPRRAKAETTPTLPDDRWTPAWSQPRWQAVRGRSSTDHLHTRHLHRLVPPQLPLVLLRLPPNRRCAINTGTCVSDNESPNIDVNDHLTMNESFRKYCSVFNFIIGNMACKLKKSRGWYMEEKCG